MPIYALPAIRRLWRDESGVATVEYALLLALIAAAVATSFAQLGCNMQLSMARTNWAMGEAVRSNY